eukprot:TRINITY_DN18973_c0_g1_i1.p1 TRINITY_DN18973_c0_g1~~TRINITY_DN18973_c0_g1_i1.p1  ORF type:complete len:787 (-),score=142.82 TRINITY_DN18973_c0_g1_i1:84-2444(-)
MLMACRSCFGRSLLPLPMYLLLSLLVAIAGSSLAERSAPPPVLLITGKAGMNDHMINGEYVLQPVRLNGQPVWSRQVLQHRQQHAYVLMSDCGQWMVTGVLGAGGAQCDAWARCLNASAVPALAAGDAAGDGGIAAQDGPPADAPEMPWHCSGRWEAWTGREGWKEVGATNNHGYLLELTPIWAPPARATGRGCSRREERQLARRFGRLDIVIPWVNGSDPEWLAKRKETCDEWTWRWMWPDAIRTSAGVRRCLVERVAIKEAEAFVAKGRCAAAPPSPDADADALLDAPAGQAACAEAANGSQVTQGLTNRDSVCFKRFDACAARVFSIGDHDELRYLLRSIELNMRWHRGRIIVVLPRGQRPAWMLEDVEALARLRLQVLEQDDLIKHAMEQPEYVPWSRRGGIGGFAPDRIFSDYPVEHSIPFIKNVSKQVLLMQDDLFLARPTSPCEFFIRSPYNGMRLYGHPWEGEDNPNPHDNIYRQMQETSALLWARGVDANSSGPDPDAADGSCAASASASGAQAGRACGAGEERSADTSAQASDQAAPGRRGQIGNASRRARQPYYMPYHLPMLLDVATLRRLWRRFPVRLSASIDTPFRSANVTDIVGLHHTEVAARSSRTWRRAAKKRRRMRRGRPLPGTGVAMSVRPDSASRVFDLDYHMRDQDQTPMRQRIIKEVRFYEGTGREWARTTGALLATKADPKRLPMTVSFQDALGRSEALELDCKRENWLLQVYPTPSAAEDPAQPPSRCAQLWTRQAYMAAGIGAVVVALAGAAMFLSWTMGKE